MRKITLKISFILSIEFVLLIFYNIFNFAFLEPKISSLEIDTGKINTSNNINRINIKDLKKVKVKEVIIINKTFLGNDQRNYYGNKAPSELNVIWKTNLGSGYTLIGGKVFEWFGAGWTGQPLLVMEADGLYLIQGSNDHHLKKINAKNGNLVWEYDFNDVIKGTGTIWENPNTDKLEDKYVILQGARSGFDSIVRSRQVQSYRAISYMSGKELWRMPMKRTSSYSRDVDASALVLGEKAYIGLENGIFTVFDPDHKNAIIKNNITQPKILDEEMLFTEKDKELHGGNLVTESSPVLLDNHIYVSSGSGHVYGYNLKTEEIDWDFYIGSDLDGSAIVTYDSCILVSVEKQYIKGQGGVFKLDPSKDPEDAVIWYFPVPTKGFNDWLGGIIGSVGINDYYHRNDNLHLAVFQTLGGEMFVVEHDKINNGKLVWGPNKKKKHNTPVLIHQEIVGVSISTPVIIDNRIIIAGYEGIKIFEYDKKMNFKLLAEMDGVFEATPFVWDERIYIASKNGYLYCLGEK